MLEKTNQILALVTTDQWEEWKWKNSNFTIIQLAHEMRNPLSLLNLFTSRDTNRIFRFTKIRRIISQSFINYTRSVIMWAAKKHRQVWMWFIMKVFTLISSSHFTINISVNRWPKNSFFPFGLGLSSHPRNIKLKTGSDRILVGKLNSHCLKMVPLQSTKILKTKCWSANDEF